MNHDDAPQCTACPIIKLCLLLHELGDRDMGCPTVVDVLRVAAMNNLDQERALALLP